MTSTTSNRLGQLVRAAALSGAVLALPGAGQAAVIEAKVVGIADGDTLTVLVDGHQRVHVRLADVDAPEKAQAFGQVSKRSLSDLCFGKVAVVDVQQTDRYGRSIARVSCAGVDASEFQVRGGMAWAYRQYLHRPEFIKLEADARAKNAGLWADRTPVPPWEFRHATKGDATSAGQATEGTSGGGAGLGRGARAAAGTWAGAH